MDENATILSTGKVRIWRLRRDRDAVRDVIGTRLGIGSAAGRLT
jgi:hypothetical protein